MNKLYILFLILVICSCSSREENNKDYERWEGIILVNNYELKLIFKFNNKEAVLDVPAQAVLNYPASKLTLSEDSVCIVFSGIMDARFKGVNNGSVIEGSWIQLGKSYPITLRRKKEYSRPQSPKPPFLYKVEQVSYRSRDKKIRFGGTLTIPESKTNYPVAILISGSGQQDRDATIFGHKPFHVIADYLTRHGIAVLRFDDRGIGETSGKATLVNATSSDFALDVIAGIEYLKNRKDIDNSRIGLIGHSEGGLIATLVGAMRNDMAFIVSLAGVGIPGEELVLSQIEKSLQQFVSSPSIDSIMAIEQEAINVINQESNNRLAEVTILQKIQQRVFYQDSVVKEYFGIEIKDGFENFNLKNTGDRYKQMMQPWYRYFLLYNPEQYLCKINAPLLVLNGEKDTQVLADLNLNGFRTTLDKYGKTNYKIIRYPDLNHFFQHCETGYYDEVELIDETISGKVLDDISVWINMQVQENDP